MVKWFPPEVGMSMWEVLVVIWAMATLTCSRIMAMWKVQETVAVSSVSIVSGMTSLCRASCCFPYRIVIIMPKCRVIEMLEALSVVLALVILLVTCMWWNALIMEMWQPAMCIMQMQAV